VGGVGDRRVGRSHCRTFPGHSFLGTERGTAALRRVLVAYARHNPALGYCQSMNLLCGILLLFLDDEAAFWVLEALLLHIMPAGYYSHSMDAAVADQSVFADLVLERLPHVHMHLRRLGVELRLISMEWFLCLFSSTFEPSAALRECGRPSPGADVAGAGPSPGADVAGASPVQAYVAAVSPVQVQMWQGRAQSRCRCGCSVPSPGADVAGASPSPGADVAGASPVQVQMWQGRAQSRCRCGSADLTAMVRRSFVATLPSLRDHALTSARAHSRKHIRLQHQHGTTSLPSPALPAASLWLQAWAALRIVTRSCALALVNAHIRFNQTRLCECGTS
jgi:hypothetical protein